MKLQYAHCHVSATPLLAYSGKTQGRRWRKPGQHDAMIESEGPRWPDGFLVVKTRGKIQFRGLSASAERRNCLNRLPTPASDKRYASRRSETTTSPRRAARRPPRWRGSTRSLAAPRRPGLGQRPCSKARVKFSSPDALPRRSDARRNVQFGGSVVEVRENCQVEPEPTATAASRDPVGTRKSLSVQARCYSGRG